MSYVIMGTATVSSSTISFTINPEATASTLVFTKVPVKKRRAKRPNKKKPKYGRVVEP